MKSHVLRYHYQVTWSCKCGALFKTFANLESHPYVMCTWTLASFHKNKCESRNTDKHRKWVAGELEKQAKAAALAN